MGDFLLSDDQNKNNADANSPSRLVGSMSDPSPSETQSADHTSPVANKKIILFNLLSSLISIRDVKIRINTPKCRGPTGSVLHSPH